MKDFKQTHKMSAEGSHYKSGGKVKKMAGGGEVKNYTPDPKVGFMFAEKYGKPHKEVEKEIIGRKNYQDDPDYMGYEDSSTSGRAAVEAYDSNHGDEKNDYYKPKSGVGMLSKSGVKKAQQAAATVKEAEKTNPMGDTYKRGGKVKRGKVTKK